MGAMRPAAVWRVEHREARAGAGGVLRRHGGWWGRGVLPRHGEAPGEWVGRSAFRLELIGEVDGDDLAALLRHADPRSGDQLTRGRSSPKSAGFDLTFCAPKSVSLLWAFGTPEVAAEVVAAHEAAVRAALGVMEVEAGKVRRGHGGVHVLPSSGLVAAAFRHRTSRAGDPHLHTHVVTANVGWCDGDGRWSALDARPLYRWAQPVGYLYEAQLRDELTRRLGVSWGPVRNGIADIEGVPRPLVDLFSTRRRQILEHLEAHGTSGGRAAQVATYATRRPKEPTASADGLQGAWMCQAVDAGHSPWAVAELARLGLGVPAHRSMRPSCSQRSLARTASRLGAPPSTAGTW